MITAEDTLAQLDSLLWSSNWSAVVEMFRRLPSRAIKDSREVRARVAIALIRGGRIDSGVAMIEGLDHLGPERELYWRMLIAKTLMRTDRNEQAIIVLSRVIAGAPDAVEELRLRGSLYGRQRRYEEALADARRVVALKQRDWAAHTALLKLLIQSEAAEEAADHAVTLGADAARDEKLAQMAAIAFRRTGRKDDLVRWAEAIETAGVTTGTMAASIIRAYVEAGLPARAEDASRKYAAFGIDDARLKGQLAGAMIESEEQTPERLGKILGMMRASDIAKSNNARDLRKMGFALLRAGREREAVPVLERALALSPNSNGIRALYARALRQSERYAEAAEQFKKLLPSHPEAHNFHRYAAGALSLAGQTEEAAALFDNFVQRRRARMSDNFEQGFAALWDKADSHQVPRENLDWAWQLRRDKKDDRAEWERRAKWGYLADQFIIDWIECRDDQIQDAMMKLANLDEAEGKLSKVDYSRGAILASAHIGPMFAGPLALELLGIESRWLASTPGSIRTSYGKRLISTSDQTGAEVARQTLRTLGEGKAVVIAIDGAIALSAPRVPFEGQHVTLSSFAPRLVHRLGVPSLFVAPRWENGNIGFVVEEMPAPEEGEEVDAYVERWQNRFLDHLRDFLSGEPENLRLAGGIWRHIKPPTP